MATRPGISSKVKKALESAGVHMVFAVKAEFDTDVIRLHTAVGELEIDGEDYIGAGTLLAIGDIEDTKELKSSGIVFTFSGMDEKLIRYALAENYQNRPVTLRCGFMSGGSVTDSIVLYKGRMLAVSIADDPQGSTVTIRTENRLADLRRPSNIRYTNESQNALHPGDTGFAMTAGLADMELPWGNVQNHRVTGGGGFHSESPGLELER